MGQLGALLGTFHESDLCVACRVNEVVCLFAALHISTEIHSLQQCSMRVRQAALKLGKHWLVSQREHVATRFTECCQCAFVSHSLPLLLLLMIPYSLSINTASSGVVWQSNRVINFHRLAPLTALQVPTGSRHTDSVLCR